MSKNINTDASKSDEKEATVPSQKVNPETLTAEETVEETTMDKVKGFFRNKRKAIVTGAATLVGVAVVVVLAKKGYSLDQSTDSSNNEDNENEGGEENSI